MLKGSVPELIDVSLRLDAALYRNALLIVALRKAMAETHHNLRGHDVDRPWTSCRHASCVRARKAITVSEAATP